MMKNKRHFLINSLAFVVSILIGLFLSELLLRIFMPQIGYRPYRDIDLGWSGHKYRTFDPYKDIKQSRKNYRILFLGDSFLAGGGVKHVKECFPNVLEEMLNGSVNVKTFASGGWGTDQQYLAFLKKGLAWKPDLVVIAFCAYNDLQNILSNSHGRSARKSCKPYFSMTRNESLQLFNCEGYPINFSPAYKIKTEFRLYALSLLKYIITTNVKRKPNEYDFSRVDSKYLGFAGGGKSGEIHALKKNLSWSPQNGNTRVSAYIHEDFEINSYQWKLLEEILRSFNEDVRSIGSKLILMLLPVTFKSQDSRFITGGEMEFRFNTPDGEFTFRAAEPRDRLKLISNRLEIDFYDPTRTMIQIVRNGSLEKKCWPNPEDCHFSSFCHSIIAKLFYNYLIARVDYNERIAVKR